MTKGGFVESENDGGSRDALAIVQCHSAGAIVFDVEGNDPSSQAEGVCGEGRGHLRGKSGDAASRKPSAAGGEFFKIIKEKSGARSKITIEKNTAKKGFGKSGDKQSAETKSAKKILSGKILSAFASRKQFGITGQSHASHKSPKEKLVP